MSLILNWGIIFISLIKLSSSNSTSRVFLCPDDQILHLNLSSSSSKDIWSPPHYSQYKSLGVTENSSFILEKISDLKCGKSKEIKEILNETNIVFHPNGFIKYEKFYIAPKDYCIKSFKEKDEIILEIKLCIPDCSLEDVRCISKCCPIHKIMSPRNPLKPRMSPCITVPDLLWKPKVYQDFYSNETKPFDIHFTEFPRENQKILQVSGKYQGFENKTVHLLEFRYLQSSRIGIKFSQYDTCRIIPIKNIYCLEGFYNGNDFQNGLDQNTFIGLQLSEKIQDDSPINKLYGSLSIISSVFLLLTIIIYVILWNNQTIHGWSNCSLSFSMMCSYVFLTMIHFSKLLLTTEKLKHNPFCYIIGVSFHYFFLSTLSWLTILCFHMYCTFRYLKPSENNKSRKKFRNYSIFSWCFPLIIVLTTVILDQSLPESNFEIPIAKECIDEDFEKVVQLKHGYKPGYGKNSCLLDPKSYSQGLYMFYPAGFLLFLNILFFLLTTYKILMVRRETSLATKNLKNRNKQEYLLYIKLFFVMGINWSFEVISWAHTGTKANWSWIFFDVINLLQGVIIFVIFICKREIFQSLQNNSPLFDRLVNYLSSIFSKRQNQRISNGTNETEATGGKNELTNIHSANMTNANSKLQKTGYKVEDLQMSESNSEMVSGL